MSIDTVPAYQARRSSLSVAAFGVILLSVSSPAPAQDADRASAFPGRIFVISNARDDPLAGIVAVEPGTGRWSKVTGDRATLARVAPDGKLVVLSLSGPESSTRVYDVAGERPPTTILDRYGLCCWSPDSREVLISVVSTAAAPDGNQTWRFRIDGTGKEKVSIPEHERVWDWSADGRWFVTASSRRPGEGNSTLYLMHPDGTGERLLRPADPRAPDPAESLTVNFPRFSPDGRELIWVEFIRKVADGKVSGRGRVVAIQHDGTNRRVLLEGEEDDLPGAACWSPDGKWIAVSIGGRRFDPAQGPPGPPRLKIMTPEGKHERFVDLPEASTARLVVDWR